MYHEKSFGNKIKKGKKSSNVVYNIVNENLNGLQFIGGFDWGKNKYDSKKSYVAVINNNIIGSSYTNSSRLPDEKSQMESKFSIEYRKWLTIGLENPYYTISAPLTYDQEELYYNLEFMVSIFLDDFNSFLEHFSKYLKIDDFGQNNRLNEYINKLNSLKKLIKNNKVYSVFEDLEDDVIAKSYGIDVNEKIIIKVDPSKWLNASPENKWYILYHELGHDVLNLRHGQGGRMMYNYPTKKYTWEDFFNNRDRMFIYFIKKVYPEYDSLFMPFFSINN